MAKLITVRISLSVLLLLLLLSPVSLIVLSTSGCHYGVEFSPDDFSRRSFFYNRVPYVGWTLYGKEYSNISGSVGRSLIAQGLVRTVNRSPKVWHLVVDSGVERGRLEPAECDARFLTGYLDLQDAEQEYYWESWNQEHPNLAKRFWPIVAKLARNNQYVEIPPLMRLAMSLSNDDLEEFELKIKTLHFTDKKLLTADDNDLP